MKSWTEIKNEAQRGDWERVAEIAGCTRDLVEKVARGDRKDNRNLQEKEKNLKKPRISDPLKTREKGHF